jgi:hypothetical protein
VAQGEDDDAVLTQEVAKRFASDPDAVDLSPFKSLDDEAAAVLSKVRCDLHLTGIQSLSPKAATLLSQHPEGELWLDGLTSLPYDAIAPLVNHRGRLTFDGVREVSLRAAEILAKRTAALGLNGVETMSLEVAEAFAASRLSQLELLGLREPPAGVLSAFSGELYLPDPSDEEDEPKVLTKEVASQFCEDDTSVDLSEYTAINDDAADELAAYAGTFLFLNVTAISDYVAKRLASRPCGEGSDLRLSQLESLSEESVISLASWPGELRFSTDRLTPQASRALGNHVGPVLGISGLQELPLEVAANLAKHRGYLSLMFRHDADLSTEALETICRRGQRLSVTANHFDEMSDSLAAAIGKCQGDIDIGCSSLTASQAEQIAGMSGRLELNSLDTDSEAVIAALSKHRGSLSLQGLQSLSVDAARSLSKHEGEVSLCLRHSELETEVLRIFDRHPDIFGDTSDPLA